MQKRSWLNNLNKPRIFKLVWVSVGFNGDHSIKESRPIKGDGVQYRYVENDKQERTLSSFVIFSGEAVLNAVEKNTNPEILISKWIPSKDLESYTWQSSGIGQVSALKTDILEKIVYEMLQSNSVIGFSIGHSSYLDFKSNTDQIVIIEDSIYKVGMNDSIEPVDNFAEGLEEYKALLLSIPELLSNQTFWYSESFGQEIKKNNSIRENKILMGAGVMLLFVILVLNTLLFQSYSKELNTLKKNNSYTIQLAQEVEKLESRFSSRNSVNSLSGLYNPQLKSHCLDAAVDCMPNGISLTKAVCNPLSKNSAQNEQILVDEGTLLISGTCSNSEEVHDWTKLLMGKQLFTSVQIERINKLANAKLNFTLIIVFG